MKTYRKRPANKIGNHPYCGNCIYWSLEHKEGTHSYTPICTKHINETDQVCWYHYGAGCTEFVNKEVR